MTPDEASWVRNVVLTAGLREGLREGACDCQGGLCLHCANGHRDFGGRCVQVAWGGAPPVHGETWIARRSGVVPGGSPRVWRAGKPCRWVCPCPCQPWAPELPPAVGRPVATQLDLFGAGTSLTTRVGP